LDQRRKMTEGEILQTGFPKTKGGVRKLSNPNPNGGEGFVKRKDNQHGRLGTRVRMGAVEVQKSEWVFGG